MIYNNLVKIGAAVNMVSVPDCQHVDLGRTRGDESQNQLG